MTSRKGSERERYIAKKFGKLGYMWMRSYASLGSFDFIAFKKAWTCGEVHSDLLLIQVKGDPWDKPDWKQLLKDSRQAGARPVYVYREIRKTKLGKTKDGKQRTQAKWITVYL